MTNHDILAIGITAVIVGFVVVESGRFRRGAKTWTSSLLFSGSIFLWLGALVIVWVLALRRDLRSALLGVPLTVFVLNLFKIVALGQREKPEVE